MSITPHRVSITTTIGESTRKTYTHHYHDDGFEMGCGPAGHYLGHAHLAFADVVYSPKGMTLAEPVGRRREGVLLVVPPRTYLPDVELSEFFFVKFSPTPQPITLPDKTSMRLSEGTAALYVQPAQIDWPLFLPPDAEPRRLTLILGAGGLEVVITNGPHYLIEP